MTHQLKIWQLQILETGFIIDEDWLNDNLSYFVINKFADDSVFTI